MLEVATGFTPLGPKCLKQGEIRKRGKGKSPWEKVQIGRERPHFWGLSAAQNFVGSLPPAPSSSAPWFGRGHESDQTFCKASCNAPLITQSPKTLTTSA